MTKYLYILLANLLLILSVASIIAVSSEGRSIPTGLLFLGCLVLIFVGISGLYLWISAVEENEEHETKE
jgi:hypothetical protein